MNKFININAKKKSLFLTGVATILLALGCANSANIVKADRVPGDATASNGRISTTIVHYQDEAGNKIADDQVIEGHDNIGFGSIRKAIEGYTLKDSRGPAEGYFDDQPQIVTYIYSKDTDSSNGTPNTNDPEQVNGQDQQSGEKQPTSDNTGTENDPNAKKPAASPTISKTNKNDGKKPVINNTANKAATLPQTGSDHNFSFGMMLAGLSALTISFLGMLGVQRKQN